MVSDMGVKLFLRRGLHMAVQFAALNFGIEYLALLNLVIQVGVGNLRVLAQAGALLPHPPERPPGRR